MILKLNVTLHYRLSEPMDLLLQIEAADLADQRVRSTEIWTSDVAHFSRVAADDGIGERIWIHAEGDFSCTYLAEIAVDRPALDISALPQTPLLSFAWRDDQAFDAVSLLPVRPVPSLRGRRVWRSRWRRTDCRDARLDRVGV